MEIIWVRELSFRLHNWRFDPQVVQLPLKRKSKEIKPSNSYPNPNGFIQICVVDHWVKSSTKEALA